jgi:flagellar protein FlbT
VALHITLKPGERVVIGGAALRNGGSGTELWIENEVPVLRETDVLPPAAASTPCERIYLALELAYVDPARTADHLATYRALAAEVAVAAPSCHEHLAAIERLVGAGRLFKALRRTRDLLAHEKGLLARVS